MEAVAVWLCQQLEQMVLPSKDSAAPLRASSQMGKLPPARALLRLVSGAWACSQPKGVLWPRGRSPLGILMTCHDTLSCHSLRWECPKLPAGDAEHPLLLVAGACTEVKRRSMCTAVPAARLVGCSMGWCCGQCFSMAAVWRRDPHDAAQERE